MAKTFYTSGTGSEQTLTNAQDEKLKIYDDKASADLDLANIADGEIVATKAGESEGVVEVVDTVEEDNPNPVSSGAVFDYVTDSLEWSYAGRIFANNGTVNVPKTAREIIMAISNTGSTLTASTISLPIRSILAVSGNDEYISAWTSIGGTAGNFTVSGDNIVVKVTTIASSYVRVWYR